MERGFASLNESLADVTEDLNFYASSIISDMESIKEDIYLITKHIEKMQRDKERALILIAEILEGLDRTKELFDNMATREQAEAILSDLEEMRETIDILLGLGDSDIDGVLNALDQCPNTPLRTPVTMFGCPLTDTDGDGVLNADDQCDETWGVEVDENGCEIEETGTTTNTTEG